MPRSPSASDDNGKRSRRRSVDASEDERRERRHRRRDRENVEEGQSRRRDHRRHGSESEDEHRAGHSRRHRDDNDGRRKHRHRSRSRDDARRERRHRSRSPQHKRRRRSESSGSRSPPSRKARGPLPSQDESYRGDASVQSRRSDTASGPPPPPKQKPNYKPTGLLAKEANTVAGTAKVLKYHEPPEARKPPPKEQWRLYVFKKKDLTDTIHLHERSVWLVGRDQSITDLYVEHPSISKQHAVVQFRYLTSTNEYGDKISRVKPYLIDLDSANGTKLNGGKVEASRYVELVDGDVVVFGESEREYVMMLPPAEG